MESDVGGGDTGKNTEESVREGSLPGPGGKLVRRDGEDVEASVEEAKKKGAAC